MTTIPAGVPRAMLGAPRNGLPAPGYRYRGTGVDALTPAPVMAAWNARVRERGANPNPTNHQDEARLAEVENELALQADAPHHPPARPAAPPPPQVRLAQLERDLAARGVIVPEPSPDKPVDYWPAYYPGPGVPGRCPDCGYMLTAPGHKATCGGEP